MVQKAAQVAVMNGESYYFEHPIQGYHDHKIRWVRALGKAEKDVSGNASHFSGVMMDITEQKQDEIRKNDFIGMVSHELKTPLTSLSAYVQILHARAQQGGDSFSAGALEKVRIQVRKMTSMINGFLNISRLESGKIVLDKEDFDLDVLVREMIEESEMTAPAHKINFTPDGPVMVYADPDKIGSVISNLLSNAVKYSPKGNVIDVLCHIEDKMAVVSIRDYGIGIAKQDVEKLFDRYYRVENKNMAHISGFGIGLYLSAEIVRRHEGKIWVDSEADKGSTFYFSLPLAS